MTTTTAQRVFEYTDEWDEADHFDSSSVERLLVNRNTGDLAVEWQESQHEVYVFSGVPRTVLDSLLDGSVGRNVQEVKRLYGPAEKFNNCWDLDQKKVDLEPKVTNVEPVTQAFSLQTPDAPVEKVEGGVTTASKNYTYSLFWDFEGVERKTVLDTDVSTLDEALNRLESQAKSLGLDIQVKRAVIDFV